MVATIIANGKATLRELTEWYTLEEGFDLYEIIAVSHYNEHLAMQHAKKQGGQK